MKIFGNIKCIAMFMASVAVMMMNSALWGVVPDAHKLGRLVNEWQCTGPHTTLMGKMREFLSIAWWLGPLKVGSARDPLKECGIPAALGWREVLPILLDLKARLACLEEQVLMADKEHEEFVLKMLLVVCCLVFVIVFGVLLARWTWTRFTLARETQSSLVVTKIKARNHDELEYYTLERRIIVMVYEMMTSDGLIIRKGKYVQFANDVSNEKHISGTFLALPSVEGTNTQSLKKEVVTVSVVVPEMEGDDDKAATSVVRRSVHVPSRLRGRLWGHEETHLTNLRDRYNVEMFTDPKRGKLHIKGSKANVLECYAVVRDLLAEWRTWEDAG